MSFRLAVRTAGSDDWLTPPEIVTALGPFDLDPCAAPEPRPWATAKTMVSRPDDGLAIPWVGRVWLNPPFSTIPAWLGRLAVHGDGIALVFARTETRWWHDLIWDRAAALLFMRGRPHFHRPDGTRAPFNSGAPVVLAAYGKRSVESLGRSGIEGAFVALGPCQEVAWRAQWKDPARRGLQSALAGPLCR